MTRLIDKDEAIKAIDDVLMEDDRYKVWLKIGIDNLKTVDAEPVRHGKWKPVSEDWRHQIEWWKCSECGFDTYTGYTYCPHCGAKMDKEQEKQSDTPD